MNFYLLFFIGFTRYAIADDDDKKTTFYLADYNGFKLVEEKEGALSSNLNFKSTNTCAELKLGGSIEKKGMEIAVPGKKWGMLFK